MLNSSKSRNLHLAKTVYELLNEWNFNVEKFSSLSNFPFLHRNEGGVDVTKRRIVQKLLTFRVSLTSCLMSFYSLEDS